MKHDIVKTMLVLAAAGMVLSGCAKKTGDYSGSLAESAPEDTPIEIITDSEVPTETPSASIVESVESAAEPTTPAPEIIAPVTIDPEVIKDEDALPIGTKAEGEYIYHKKLTNATDTGVTVLCVKDQWMDDFSDSLIAAGDTWKAGEKRDLYYDTEEAQKNAADTENKPLWRIYLMFEDGTETTLYEAPLADFEEAELREEDGYYYLVYQSLSNKEEVSTLKDEKDYRGASDDDTSANDSDSQNGSDTSASRENTENTENTTENTTENANQNGEDYEPIAELDGEELPEIMEGEEEVTDITDEDGEEFFEAEE